MYVTKVIKDQKFHIEIPNGWRVVKEGNHKDGDLCFKTKSEDFDHAEQKGKPWNWYSCLIRYGKKRKIG